MTPILVRLKTDGAYDFLRRYVLKRFRHMRGLSESFLFGKPGGFNERLHRYKPQDFAKTLK